MNFIDGILNSSGIVNETAPLAYRAVISGDKSGYFENIKGIKSYNSGEVILSLKKGELTVKGKGLVIRKYCLGDILICGKITAISVNGV